jgi:hypothetical protein
MFGFCLSNAVVIVAGGCGDEVFVLCGVHLLGQHVGVEEDGTEKSEELIGRLPFL